MDLFLVSLFSSIGRFVYLLPCSSAGKESACNAGDQGSIPGSGRFPGEGHGNSLQYSCLENPTYSPWGLYDSDTTEQLSLSPVSYCFNCYSFIVYFEFRKCDASRFALSQDFLAIWGLLWFCISFRIAFSISVENVITILVERHWLCRLLWVVWHFKNINSSNLWA